MSLAAFPGAQGHGALSIGGRGGQVYEVTRLDDAIPGPPGSFRTALEAQGPRIVVFRVGGIIDLIQPIQVLNPYLTIAGQTAPGGGILVRGQAGLRFNTHNVIARYFRVRLTGAGGSAGGQTYMGIGTGCHDVILDHISGSWTLDEGIQVWKHDVLPMTDIYNVTIQRCIMAEGLAGHGMGMLVGGHDKAVNGLHELVRDISIHHNAFIHNYDRNPRVSSWGTQVINNLVYNWGARVGVSARDNVMDLINNLWLPGPMTMSTGSGVIWKHEGYNLSPPDGGPPWEYPSASIYIMGNIVPGQFDDPAAPNWSLIPFENAQGQLVSLPISCVRTIPLPQASIPIVIQPAVQAAYDIGADVGANIRRDSRGNAVSNRDSVDQRVIADAQNRTGWTSPPVSPAAAGGFPVIAAGTPYIDTDHDGMPDEWEIFYGLNPNVADGSQDSNANGYTNLEEYLNGMRPN